jgi:hypothetical protein
MGLVNNEGPMSLAKMLRPFKSQVLSAQPIFARACSRQPALQAAGDLLGCLRLLSAEELDSPLAAALVRAILAEQRSAPGYWSQVLLVAFEPQFESIVQALRRRFPGDISESATLAFLEAVAACPVDHATPAAFLLTSTVSTLRRAARARPKEVPLDLTAAEESQASVRDLWVAPSLCEKREQYRFRAEVRAEADELNALLVKSVAGRVPAEDLQLVSDTLVGGRNLLAYVRWLMPGASPEKAAAEYHRLYRRRARTVEALAELIGPDAEDGGLLGSDSRESLCSESP